MKVGVEINQYAIVDHIGRGGMADVWSARDLRLHRMVAIKTIARDLPSEIDPLARFEVEAQIIASLEHPHILPIYDFGNFENQLYIVMRYIAGGTLSDRIIKGPLPLEKALSIGRALASALDYAHDRKIVHLDVKPLNVLVDTNQIPYLADFGLAAKVGPEGMNINMMSGSPNYAAPEQFTGDAVGRWSDIFSFGIMMYQILTGELPFGERELTGIRVLQGDPIPPPSEKIPSLPFEVDNAIHRATMIDAEGRFETVSAMMDAMEMGQDAAFSSELLEDFGDWDLDEGRLIDPEELARLEVEELFDRALRAWQQEGNFVLSVTDYMLVNDSYAPQTDSYMLLDDEAKALMLRGAIEYGREIDIWCAHTDSESQREVCLSALRSSLPSARARAIKMLRDLPDAAPPLIARTTARNLGGESDPKVRSASVELLAARAAPTPDWREAAYHPGIDRRLAEEAVKDDAPDVAEAAARTIGKLRSRSAVMLLVERGRVDRLALVRDEAPHLPPEVPASLQIRVFLSLTRRKLWDFSLLARFITAAIGGFIGMGGYVFGAWPQYHVLSYTRLLNVVGVGVPLGLLIGLAAVLAVEMPRRLRKFWPGWALLSAGWLLGAAPVLMGWAYYHVLVLNASDPAWGALLAASLAAAGAMVIGADRGKWALSAAALIGVLTGAGMITHHLYVTGQLAAPLLYFTTLPQAWELSLFFGGAVALGTNLEDIPGGRHAAICTAFTFFIQALLGMLIAPFPLEGSASAVLWMIVTFIAYAVGGTLAGRLGISWRIALSGLMANSLIHLILFRPNYGESPLAWALYLAGLAGGPLLAAWIASRSSPLRETSSNITSM